MRGRRDSDSADSDFSLWSDTGDLVDQLADEDDPLQARSSGQEADDPHASLTGRASKRKRGRLGKRVNFAAQPDGDGLPSKEGFVGVPASQDDIPVPTPHRKPVSFGHRFVALCLAPMNSHARIHGLYGQKLMSVPLCVLLVLEEN